MTRICKPGERTGCVHIPASKSIAHRLLICAALSKGPVTLHLDGLSRDILATIDCLRALGAEITAAPGALYVQPIQNVPEAAVLRVGESGSTLRFLLPLVGALGAKAAFKMQGRLPARPLHPLDRELIAHGMALRRSGETLYAEGQLQPGAYTLPGDVSSQYISGLLFALPLLKGPSTITVTGELQSAAYLNMTESALLQAHISFKKACNSYQIPGRQRYFSPGCCTVEGDWSNAAFFLCMGALAGPGVCVFGLDRSSAQGDRAIVELLQQFGAEVLLQHDRVAVRQGKLRGITIDAGPIPDLIPALSVVAALACGETRIGNAARLRLKESDRLQTTAAMLASLGADVQELPDGLVIRGKSRLTGGTVDACNDHRIAMAAATAACACERPVTVLQAQCVEKSYPRFWEDFEALGGGTK